LPRRGVILHLSTSSKRRTGVQQMPFTWTSAFDVQCWVFDVSALVRSDWSFPVNPYRWSF
jgi:hypothetical protein